SYSLPPEPCASKLPQVHRVLELEGRANCLHELHGDEGVLPCFADSPAKALLKRPRQDFATDAVRLAQQEMAGHAQKWRMALERVLTAAQHLRDLDAGALDRLHEAFKVLGGRRDQTKALTGAGEPLRAFRSALPNERTPRAYRV